MKEKLQILPSDINLPGIILMFFENSRPDENQYHFVIYQNNSVVGGLIILEDSHIDIYFTIRHFSLHPSLPHHYICKKLARLVHGFAREKGASNIEIHEDIQGTPFYEMLKKALEEEKQQIEAEQLHHV